MSDVDMTALWREDATEEEVIEVYQHLIDTGQAWQLEGHVGRTAMSLIESGLCRLGEKAYTDYWGNRVPAYHELVPGTKGTPEYMQDKLEERGQL